MLILLATLGHALGQTRPAASPQDPSAQTQAELKALQALMTRVEAQLPRKPKVSATQVHTPGYWDTKEMTTAWYGIMRRFLPAVHEAHPEVLTYWVMRTESPDRSNKFAADAQALVASTPALAPFAPKLQEASDALIKEASERERLSFSLAPKQELAKMYAALDLRSKRWNLILVVRDIFRSASEAGPSVWQPIFQFLRNDADAQWNASIHDRDERLRVVASMTKAFWNATSPPAAATAHFEKLEVLSAKIELLRDQALESALSPGQTPRAFLDTDAVACINAQIEFDRELAGALAAPEVEADPSLIKLYDGVYPVWESLERRESLLRGGRWTQGINLLTAVARVVLLAESWDWNEFNPESGEAGSDFAVQRAGQTVDFLNRYKEDGLKSGTPRGPLYAIVEVDEQGHILWTHCGWTVWKWAAADDMDDLATDGRLSEGLGRRWVLPAGSAVKSIRSFEDVSRAHARELIVALDPVAAPKGEAKATR